jgi:hypothetical protein
MLESALTNKEELQDLLQSMKRSDNEFIYHFQEEDCGLHVTI